MSPFATDMRRHFHDRLGRLIGDTLDTCQRNGVTADDGITVVVAPLLNTLCAVVSTAGGSEDDLVELVRAYFRGMKVKDAMRANDD